MHLAVEQRVARDRDDRAQPGIDSDRVSDALQLARDGVDIRRRRPAQNGFLGGRDRAAETGEQSSVWNTGTGAGLLAYSFALWRNTACPETHGPPGGHSSHCTEAMEKRPWISNGAPAGRLTTSSPTPAIVYDGDLPSRAAANSSVPPSLSDTQGVPFPPAGGALPAEPSSVSEPSGTSLRSLMWISALPSARSRPSAGLYSRWLKAEPASSEVLWQDEFRFPEHKRVAEQPRILYFDDEVAELERAGQTTPETPSGPTDRSLRRARRRRARPADRP